MPTAQLPAQEGTKGPVQTGAPYAKSGEGAESWAPDAWGSAVAAQGQEKSEQVVVDAMRQGAGGGGGTGPGAARVFKCGGWERATLQFCLWVGSFQTGLPTNWPDQLLASLLAVLELRPGPQGSPRPHGPIPE